MKNFKFRFYTFIFSFITIVSISNIIEINKPTCLASDFVYTLSASKILASKPTDPGSLPAWASPESMSAWASFGAFTISIVALIQSSRSALEQKKREKREEFRNLLEKLVSLREDVELRVGKAEDQNEKASTLEYFNTKRSIFLHSAESIEKDISQQISPSEYIILANENFSESDFDQARKFYEKAVKASEKMTVSKYVKCTANRSLGYYYWQNSYANPEKGREYYQAAIESIGKVNEIDLVIKKISICLELASLEISKYFYKESREILEQASGYLENFPEADQIPKHIQNKDKAELWKKIGIVYFQSISHDEKVKQEKIHQEKVRKIFNRGLNLLISLNIDYLKELKGDIFKELAECELGFGSNDKSEDYAFEGLQCFSCLDENYPCRNSKIKDMGEILIKIFTIYRNNSCTTEEEKNKVKVEVERIYIKGLKSIQSLKNDSSIEIKGDIHAEFAKFILDFDFYENPNQKAMAEIKLALENYNALSSSNYSRISKINNTEKLKEHPKITKYNKLMADLALTKRSQRRQSFPKVPKNP
jgi:tetratricopeptide (TPR) repeat protein